MITALNVDVFTLIFSHIPDFEVLRTTAAAIETSSQHPLRSVILGRLLQFPLHLSSENLEDSKALIDHFIHNAEHANLVRDVVIVLGPSRKNIAERQRLQRYPLTEDLEQAGRAEELVKLLPELLKLTENLQHLDWSDSPPPNTEIFEGLSKNSTFTHLSIDCFGESDDFPDPGTTE